MINALKRYWFIAKNYLFPKAIKKFRGSAIINSRIDSTSKIESGSHIVNSSFERYSFCGYDCEIINAEIGAFCSIANNVTIGAAMHPMEWVSTSPVFYKGKDSVRKKFIEYDRPHDKRTIIGNDVWLGGGSFIKQGISIGDGAVVGMGAVVTKSVPPYAIVGGIPAKIIRYRFDEITIRELLESKWWLLPDEKLSLCAPYIKEPFKFLTKIKEIE